MRSVAKGKSTTLIVDQIHSLFTSSSVEVQSCICRRPLSNLRITSRPLYTSISSYNHNIVCRKSLQLPSCISSLNTKRFYSKDNDDKNNDKENTDTGSIEYDGKTYQVEKDPWIKSLLADIQKDFNLDDHKDDTPTDGKNNEKPVKTQEFQTSNASNHENTQDLKYEEYDYQIAEDIEEYGYFNENDVIEKRPEKHVPISLNRGKAGVFELEELLTLMEHHGAGNIVNVPIPHEANYCDNMVIVTAKSQRHLQALNSEMLWIHKRKKFKKDPILHIEGLEKSEWCAMDLGNVVLHIFLNEERRQYYDIESLWLLGPDNDPKCLEENQPSLALSPEELYWMEIGGKDNEIKPSKEGH